MSLSVRIENDVTILTPRGMLIGGPETDELRNRIVELDAAGNQHLLVNLRRTTFVSSMGLAALYLAHAKYVRRGACVKLCDVDRKIMQVFVLVKLPLVYGDDLHDTEADALAAFRRMAHPVG